MNKSYGDSRFDTPHSNPRWWWGGSYTPNCFNCMHFRGLVKGKIQCVAFPDGIPKALMEKGATHNKPYPGDGGILYKKIDDEHG